MCSSSGEIFEEREKEEKGFGENSELGERRHSPAQKSRSSTEFMRAAQKSRRLHRNREEAQKSRKGTEF